VRVHGRNYKDWFRKSAGRDARYDYLYAAGELEPWAKRIRALAEARPRFPRGGGGERGSGGAPRGGRVAAEKGGARGAGAEAPAAEVAGEGADDGADGIAPDVYVVTNNHFRGQAAANAKMLESMIEGRRVEAPETLLAAYPDALGPYAVPAANEPMGAPELFPR
jgi:uncharacterized protein YecE (DUF72 family)